MTFSGVFLFPLILFIQDGCLAVRYARWTVVESSRWSPGSFPARCQPPSSCWGFGLEQWFSNCVPRTLRPRAEPFCACINSDPNDTWIHTNTEEAYWNIHKRRTRTNDWTQSLGYKNRFQYYIQHYGLIAQELLKGVVAFPSSYLVQREFSAVNKPHHKSKKTDQKCVLVEICGYYLQTISRISILSSNLINIIQVINFISNKILSEKKKLLQLLFFLHSYLFL